MATCALVSNTRVDVVVDQVAEDTNPTTATPTRVIDTRDPCPAAPKGASIRRYVCLIFEPFRAPAYEFFVRITNTSSTPRLFGVRYNGMVPEGTRNDGYLYSECIAPEATDRDYMRVRQWIRP